MGDTPSSSASQAGDHVTVSVVSHGHGPLLPNLIGQLLASSRVAQIIVTINKPESIGIRPTDRIKILVNSQPLGFGVNHNRAFKHCKTPYFCVLNPDITLSGDVFGTLIHHLRHQHAAIAAPIVLSPAGQQEDSWRHFPTPLSLCAKALGNDTTIIKVPTTANCVYPDWVGGMCMLIVSDNYRQLNGFDEGFFLYYEDVDICVRAWKASMTIIGCADVHVLHDAQRASRRNWRHMRWHAYSMLRYFVKYLGRLPAVTSCRLR